MEVHEAHEHIEHAGHSGGKRIALLIAVLAALLAVTELGVQGAQNLQISSNIRASDLWAFYQAKSIRQTTLRTAAEAFDAIGVEGLPPDRAEAVRQRVATWLKTVERYDSEPATGEGRKELTARAKAAEEEREHAQVAYHHFEYGAAALQLAIVLASATVITGAVWLAVVAGGLGLVGATLSTLGWFAPTLLHLH